MTTDEYVRQYMPGELERKEDSARYDEIVACMESGKPLPDGFDSTIERATASYIKSRVRERRSGVLPEVGYRKCLEDMRRSFIKEYRAHVTKQRRYEEILANGLKFSQKEAYLMKNIGNMLDEEIIDYLLALFGIVFNECDEKSLRKKWNEGKEKRAEETKEAKKNKKTAAAVPVPDELREAWNGFAEMRKKKKKPITERAGKMLYKRLMEISGGDLDTAGKILDEATRNSWTDVWPLSAQPQKAKTGIYSSDASYDISAYEKDLVALKYIEEE